MVRVGRGRLCPAFSPGIPRSRHALRHSGPWGFIRLRPARSYATRCASSCRNVRSVSSCDIACRAGFNSTTASGHVARPAVDLIRAFHLTATLCASELSPNSRQILPALFVSSRSFPGGRSCFRPCCFSPPLKESCNCRVASSTPAVSVNHVENSRVDPGCSP